MSGVLHHIHAGSKVTLRSVHGKYLSAQEDGRAEWNRDIDISDASFPARRRGSVSIRVFSDGGHTSHSREDFDITPASKKWWEE